MKLVGPEAYKLVKAEVGFRITNLDGTNRLSQIATSTMPKIYIVSLGEWPVYVGATKQRLRTRIGMKPAEGSGYYGYTFQDDGTGLMLHVWAHADAEDRNHLDVETVEAELVFLIRQAGQWPLFQTEIHFHPSAEIHRNVAQQIFGTYSRSETVR
ncbi:hypothetical protein [Rhizobium laguerreae]|uniref:hypothetical protein n=1 Tax=Rhizobium laguerreae TaxID=1076926 RepID=UPI001C900A53|nr:hypothetical protein [Rhizobium laguerreae]MBY3343450.1 hypothetical protein [Rhizobium laguerreae]MBY3350483.1 hypothetical protein [Rhizobium laguerreae]MBY3371588.1 hypothetical protein [Rhizobium laguerreae]MBY3426826.1 hypothetical protein [Rhizobium laguerreae]MBY3435334.1 hypothetical protein [Rhizobium laguerreae]